MMSLLPPSPGDGGFAFSTALLACLSDPVAFKEALGAYVAAKAEANASILASAEASAALDLKRVTVERDLADQRPSSMRQSPRQQADFAEASRIPVRTLTSGCAWRPRPRIATTARALLSWMQSRRILRGG